ncbi:TcfC E-set like domain-containing protein [Salmonella enterica]|nr:TcfC E-set like domain-containing protein [Salmonella enterica]
MKKRALALLLLPVTVPAAEMTDMTLAANIRGLPADFRRYFYNSELVVQVYLNDTRLFDAVVTLKEGGDIRLLRTLDEAQEMDPAVRALWRGVLQTGVSAGQCVKDCPAGLMAVQYRLDNAVLKLYTAHYETARVAGTYLDLPEDTPGGVIMYNSASVTGAAQTRSWGISSSLISSFGGWSQKTSFQSSGTDGSYRYRSASLYELYTRKELPGSFVHLGLFAPDSDTGNVQTAGTGYDTVVGGMWGTSDALLVSTDSVSLWPVWVTGRSQSVAEVWREGRLLHTQQLQPGVQALDTRPLPGGIYDITLRILENGRTVDTQQAQIYKPQGWSDPARRWRMNLWSGQRRTLATGEEARRGDNAFSAGGGIDVLAHPRVILGVSGAAATGEHQVRTQANITLSPDDTLFARYTQGSTAHQSNRSADFRYYRNIAAGSSASLFWRTTTTDVYGRRTASRQQGETRGGSLSLRLPWSTSLVLNTQHTDTAWRRGWGSDVSATTQATLWGRSISFRAGAYNRPGFNNGRRDNGVSLSASISLAPAARHTLQVETGMSRNQGYSGLNYHWQSGGDSYIRSLGGGVSYSPHNTTLSGSAVVDTPYVSGDAWVQHGTRESSNTAGGNLSQVLVMGGGRVAAVNGNSSRSLESALIVDVEAEDGDANVMASGGMSETRLRAGRNVVPAQLWKQDTVQFSAAGGESVQVFPPDGRVQMQRGSVKYMKVKAVKTFTVVGMLRDENGDILKNRYVSSDVGGGVINAEGVLTLDAGTGSRTLKVRAENGRPALECALPEDMDRSKKVQFVDMLTCRAAGGGES